MPTKILAIPAVETTAEVESTPLVHCETEDLQDSGIFAHFRSRERLQQETLAAARVVIDREVIVPALAVAPGLGRLHAMTQAFFSYVERAVFPGGASSRTCWPKWMPGPARSATRSRRVSAAGGH